MNKKQVAVSAPVVSQGIQKQGSRLKGVRDIRWEPLYDTYSFTAGAVLAAGLVTRFFSTPIGQGSPAKTYSDTNMSNAGVLPSPQMFRVYGIRMEAIVTDPADALFLPALEKFSSVRFFVGTKDYLEVPLAEVCGQIFGQLSGGKTDGSAKVGIYQLGAPCAVGYKYPKNGYTDILATENFGVEWTITSGASFTINSGVKVKCYLEGYRAVEVR